MVKGLQRLLWWGLVTVGLFMLFPFFWMAITSVKESGDVFAAKPNWIPWLQFRPTIKPYHVVWTEISFARYTLNSLAIALAVTAGQVLTSSLAAFAFARLRFPGRDQIFLSYLGTMMVPATVTMIPVYILLRELHWIDTYKALILPAMFSAYGTFLLRQFFVSIPRELEEAARVDGCGYFGIYRQIILPLSLPALSTLAIFTFIGNWRSFMWPLIVTNSDEHYTLPVGLAAFRTLHGTIDWPVLMAGSMLMTIPMILVFILGQRYFIEGIRLGGVKG
ncbi:MAG: carbohydrate ABC transporter permease [Armatimonadetes bacterium]|nr:carbohydrate ABC transporter permease [Armatimonadota bacterium]